MWTGSGGGAGVDGEHLTGDERAGVAAQHQRRADEFVGLTDPTERRLRDEFATYLNDMVTLQKAAQ